MKFMMSSEFDSCSVLLYVPSFSCDIIYHLCDSNVCDYLAGCNIIFCILKIVGYVYATFVT